jgi:N-acetylglucosaminyldiphosphoundecaprenol N-acetyl-beta-D-mannosaminyltransferase
MNRSGLEWMHRIATDPRRLWKRYAFSVLPLLQLYWQELSGRVSR